MPRASPARTAKKGDSPLFRRMGRQLTHLAWNRQILSAGPFAGTTPLVGMGTPAVGASTALRLVALAGRRRRTVEPGHGRYPPADRHRWHTSRLTRSGARNPRAPLHYRKGVPIAPVRAPQTSPSLCQQAVIVPSTVGPPSRYQLTDLLAEIVAGQAGDQLRDACAFHQVSAGTLGRVIARLIEAGAHKGDGWTGYLKHTMVALVDLSERTVRRCVKVLRAVNVLDGAPPAPYQGEDGRWCRGPTTLRLTLPPWARSAHWKKAKSLVAPTGQHWPLSRPAVTVDAYKTKGEDTETPVDSAPPWPRPPLPDAYLAERAALDSRNAAANTGRGKRRRRR